MSNKKSHLLIDINTPSFDKAYFEKGPLFVYVFMRGCPYCEMMNPEWTSLRKKNKINTIMVNHLMLEKLKEKETSLRNIRPQMFPHLELIPNVETKRGVQYNGPRDVQNFLAFIESNLQQSKKPNSSTTSTKNKKPSAKTKKSIKTTSNKGTNTKKKNTNK